MHCCSRRGPKAPWILIRISPARLETLERRVNEKDSLTKATVDAFKVVATYLERKTWVVRFNHDFVSARKQQRLRKTRELQEAA